MSLDNTPKPGSHRRDRLVSTAHKFPANRCDLLAHALAHSLPFHHKLPPSGISAIMRESQEVKSFRLSLSLLASLLTCKTTKTQNACLLWVQTQIKLSHSIGQFFLEPSRVSFFLKPQHGVSQPREPPPRLLSEPYVSLSTHTAPIIQPKASHRTPSAETCGETA